MSKKEAIEKLLEKVSANLWDYTSPNVAITNKHIADSKKLIDQAIALSKPEPLRNQPCGCILCDCDSEGRCLGCGSKMCGKHQEIGHLPKNEMAYHKAEQLPASDFTKENRDFINDANRDFQAGRVKGSCIEDYIRALRELGKACDIIEQLQAQHEEDENIYKQVAGHNDILIAENKKLLEGQAKVNK